MHKIRIAALALAILAAAVSPGSAQQTASVTVSVTDLKSISGQLVVCLWSTRAGFPTCRAGDGVPRHTFAINARTMQVALPIPRAGSFAVTVVHDENNNGRLGQNFIGMPTEGVGVSNNPGGIPRFNASLVELTPGSQITVRMRYLFD